MCCFVWLGAAQHRPFFLRNFQKTPKFSDFYEQITSKLQANYKQIKRNYLIYNKIKFLFFLLKSIENNKIVVYLQCQTTYTNNQQNNTTMKTQLNQSQDWEKRRAAAVKIYEENGEKMRVKICAHEYELVTSDKDDVRWYSGRIDEEVAAIFMDTDGDGSKYYHLEIDPLLRAYIVKTTRSNEVWRSEIKRINEKLVTII